MVIAALVSFGALLIAWILAPEGRTTEHETAAEAAEAAEGLPIAA